jgi:3-methyladenine DNA glycosylase/8-oxoguanine DNA glycosylase
MARRRSAGVPELPDEEIAELLTDIPGIGAWTVNVYLIFNLARADVCPPPTSASGAACD